MKVVCKIWIDQDGKAFGDGPYELLKKVEKTASLHKAAGQMGMAYSKAWKLIRSMEQRLGFFLLDRKVGGRSGGGSQITPRQKSLCCATAGFDMRRKGPSREFTKNIFLPSISPRREGGANGKKNLRHHLDFNIPVILDGANDQRGAR